MRCPFCKTLNTSVVNSRLTNNSFSVRRRRYCKNCDRRFTTYEKREEGPMRLIKKDGSREAFDHAKILGGLLKACEKRPISINKLDEIANKIELQVYESFDKEVNSKFVGELVMEELKNLDQVAYVRFASVYREFTDANAFIKELKPMLGKQGGNIKEKRAGKGKKVNKR